MAKGYLYDNGDELITREDVNEVPDSSTAHAGDVLELDSNKKPKWTTPESGLPDTSEASVGDVLTLDSDKYPVWSTPSGGGGSGVLIDATGAYTSVSFNEGTYSGTPISGSLADYIDDVESGKMLIIVTEPMAGVTVYNYPFCVNPVEAYNMIVMGVYTAGATGEAYIGYPTDHPNDLYYMIEGQA